MVKEEELYQAIHKACYEALVMLEKQGFNYKELSWFGNWKNVKKT